MRYLNAKHALEDFVPLNQQQREVKAFLVDKFSATEARIVELEAALRPLATGAEEARSDLLYVWCDDAEAVVAAACKALGIDND